MKAAEAKLLYYRLLNDVWNGEGANAEEFVSKDFRMHTAGIPSASFQGPDGLRRLVSNARAPFSSIVFSVSIGPIVQGDLIAALWSATGTYAGGLPGATVPAGTQVRFSGHDFFRIEADQLMEYWGGADDADLMNQLGMFSK